MRRTEGLLVAAGAGAAVVLGIAAAAPPLIYAAGAALVLAAALIPPPIAAATFGAVLATGPLIGYQRSAAAAAAIFTVLVLRQQTQRPDRRLVLLVLALLGTLGLSYAFAGVPGGAGILRGYLLAAALVLAGHSLSRLRAGVSLGLLVGAVALLASATRGTAGRLTLETLNANSLGVVTAIGFVTTAALLFSQHKFLALAAAPFAVALLASGSRGSALAAVGGLAFVMIQSRRRLLLTLYALLLVTAVVPGWYEAILKRLLVGRGESSLTSSVANRTSVRDTALRRILDEPWGAGLGRFPELSGIELNAHNEYLRIAAEAGVLAATLLTALVIWPLWLWRRSAHREAWLAAGVAAWTVALLFGTFGANAGPGVFGWLLTGLLLGTLHSHTRTALPDVDDLANLPLSGGGGRGSLVNVPRL